ncbi:hypothetical protein HFU84_01585 [Acidithiobacillus sp. CV18-2]|uniref:Uncharacterized protein n=1 Tax=Igneacidithiobacillus copahuensis TaxID=2724909 RepID=A0AAE3CKN7_9PROT|nr:hypothetical protein [Igneacidithiobacillus copahuensis]MBU2753413.1 hypothetical protein [Acidithiobacillus sp. CV18-3]MBU2756443.1 hypothetical protein [Acidithiobacillus sp. BN09-2]MBU2776230.1 hypothetical protein [Acidithiobacillus sp. CV18-2]MBU2795642.1 hypothetical protein [Acidithiobacillus sp. VAN18-2]MBU2798358.1 hypothetical protein [Acidithiobacillus sp. VAN18-4]UTV81728.1 hypothetical protein MQE22_03640 [Acidithiobacillus sp. YTS05]
MTYAELMEFLDSHVSFSLLHSQDVDSALSAAEAGTLEDPLASEVLTGIYRANACSAPDSEVTRADSFSGLAALRLRSQADDADAQLFRQVLQLSQTLDRAFDEETLRQKKGA